MVMAERWFVLGFTADEVVGAFQDARLAHSCHQACSTAGLTAGTHVLQGSGEGDHLVYWFISGEAARVLDAAGIQWRNRVIGHRAAPPERARCVFG
jgi:hypothetical protein